MSDKLPPGFLACAENPILVFVDRESEEMRARRSRVRSKLKLRDASLPRYHWSICSDGAVDSMDLQDHVSWILSALRTDCNLAEDLDRSYRYWMSVFWEGNGTGGGPVLSIDLIDILNKQRLPISVSFYLGGDPDHLRSGTKPTK